MLDTGVCLCVCPNPPSPYTHKQQVQFNGCSRACLVPYASYCNHSIWPHIVFYGTLHQDTNSMRFTTFRTIKAGQQVYLGYGGKDNADLLVYYGFAIKDNPYDVLELQVMWDVWMWGTGLYYDLVSSYHTPGSTWQQSLNTHSHRCQPRAKQRVVQSWNHFDPK